MSDDYLAGLPPVGSKDPHDELAQRRAKAARKLSEAEADPGRPIVMVSDNEAATVNETLVRLAERAAQIGTPVFQRSGALVVVQPDDEGCVSAVELGSVPAVRDLVSGHVTFAVEGRKGPKVISPPRWLAPAVHARTNYDPLRRLSRVTTAPTLRVDGSVVDVPGYDPASKVFFAPRPGCEFPPLPEPTQESAQAAARLILDVFAEFPFTSDADRAALLALIVTIVGRDLIAGPTPLFLVEGNAPGVGKGKLTETACVIATGKVPPLAPQTDDAEELRKHVTDIARRGDSVMVLDNATRVGGPVLDALATATRWQARLLGSSVTGDWPWRTVTAITGNNARVMGDAGRRILRIRLLTDEPNPETRTFRGALPRDAVRRYPELHVAALTIVRAGLSATVARGAPWGSYESWGEVVQLAVIWAFGVDPLKGRLEASALDSDESLIALQSLLVSMLNLGEVSPSELIEKAESRLDANADLREALSVLAAGRDGRLTPAAVGTALARYRNRPVDVQGIRYTLRQGRTGTRRYWQVETTGGAQQASERHPGQASNLGPAHDLEPDLSPA
ncbi:MAG: hypothetical protein IPH44_19270 [Myxococcales bacterium]|nr:hypothetical protein [Myxococcales bacterium]